MEKVRLSLFPTLPLLVIWALFSSGCAHSVGQGSSQAVIATSEAFSLFSGEFENTAYFKRHKPSTISVLPFQDLERKMYSIDFDAEKPANIVRRGMYNHIASLPFRDLEIADTDARLQNAGITDVRSLTAMIKENPKKLKSILGVDAAVTGTVTHFDRIFAGIYSQVAVGCEVRMWDLETGDLLWRAEHVSRAHAGGLSLNPIGLVVSTVASVWNLRQSEMLSQTDELFREIVSTIELPESALAARKAAPKIDLFAAMNAEKPYALGHQVAFRIIGDPGCKAYVDIGEFKSGIDLHPVSPQVKQALDSEVLEAIKRNYRNTGHELTPQLLDAVKGELASRQVYEGSYTVEPNEEAYGLIAKSYLVDGGGNMTTAIDPVHTIHIDSVPPRAVVGLKAESLDGKVKLVWSQSREKDLVGYEIWTSASALSGYALAQNSETNAFVIPGLTNFTPVYMKVRAIDRAENAGEFSKQIAAVPLPEPNLYDLPNPGPSLGGDIAEKMLLLAEKGPYTVFSDVRVVSGGLLYIEPGVEMLFAPDTTIEVDGGGFMAFGQEQRPIRLAPSVAGGMPGSWQGMVLKNASKSLLRYVTIEKASVGLMIENSSPTVLDSTVTGCSQAGIYLKDHSKPNIRCSFIAANEGQGALVMEGEGLSPVIRNNVFDGNSPFQVQSYTPFKIDLTDNFWGTPEPEAEWFLGDIVWEPVLTEMPVSCSNN